MAEKEYIERERIKKFFDGIYDCADLTFEPNDHCCAADDCAHCKWYEAKNAIQKRILSIHAADVRPVVRGIWEKQDANLVWNDVGLYAAAYKCNRCGELNIAETNFCPNCGADMKEES